MREIFPRLNLGNLRYKEVWEPIHGQILQSARETSNRFDPFAVSVVNIGEIVGHLTQRISDAFAVSRVNSV